MKIKTLINHKRNRTATALVRVDFNVPMTQGKVTEDFKLRQSLADIHYLLARVNKVVLMTHWGDPQGRRRLAYSTAPLAKHLGQLLKTPVEFLDLKNFDSFKSAQQKIAQAPAKSIFLLENLRFFPGESDNDPRFAKMLASLADIYINNAFAVSHRPAASVVAVKKYLPSFAGWLLKEEVKHLDRILNPQTPLAVVIGGQKMETKTRLIKNLYRRADYLLIGGALANNFLVAAGHNVGKSLIDKESIKIAQGLWSKNQGRKKKKPEIILPVDVLTAEYTKNPPKKTKVNWRLVDRVGKKEYIGDIGPQTVALFAEYINRANTIIWNGPLGKFEDPSFRQGTVMTARLIAARSRGRAFGVSGGGETVEALHLSQMGQYMDWVSTGGGAMLAYLSGEKLPGLKGLIK